MIDIINAYVKAGNSCVLITGRLVERNMPLHPTVKIEKILKYDRTTTLKRLFTWCFGFLQIVWKVVFKYRKEQLFIVSNPPIAPLLPLFVRNPYQLLLFDIYPDALTELGYMSQNSLFIKCWEKSNNKVFARAKRIFTITNSMKQVLQKYSGNKEVEVVPVWTDNNFLKPIDSDENPFIEKHGLYGKFIVLYSGNIGLSGNVEVLIDVANEIKRKDIIFLIIGDGAKKEEVQEKAIQLALNNVKFLPWQPIVELPFSLSSADLAVISIGAQASKLAVPSKLYNFLSVGAPLLCMTSKGSEVESLIERYNCGKCFDPFDIIGIARFILEVAENKELHRTMETNSLKASKDFDVSNINEFFLETGNIAK